MKKTLSVLLLVLLIQVLSAQNFFYNTRQFGMHSMLLGGAVTAGSDDLSMAYYNPAALHMAKPRANISLVQPRIERFGFGNFFGEEANNTNLDIDFSPNIASYRIPINDKINVVAITIQRSFWEQDVNSKSIVNSDLGTRENIFEYSYRGRDRWLGGGINYKMNEKLSIGWSQFISFARFNYSYTLSTNTYDPLTLESTMLQGDKVSYSLSNNLSFVTKLGLQWQLGSHGLGLVVTTPNYLAILRSGTFEKTLVDISPEETKIDEVANFELNPSLKTPWEFSIGYSLIFKNGNKLWLNGSFYPKIKDYTLSTIERLDGRRIDWVNGNRQISNFGLGYSCSVTPKLNIISSFRTNFFAYENQVAESNQERPFILDDDRLHLVIGADFHIKGDDVLIGIDWGLGRAKNTDLFDGFPNIERFSTTESTFFNGSFTLLFTYGFLFGN